MTDGDVPASAAPLASTTAGASGAIAAAVAAPASSDSALAEEALAAVLPRAPRPNLLRRALRHVRLEDVLLFGWLIVGPVLLPPATPAAAPDSVDVVAGLVDLAGMCGLAVCLIGRARPDVRSGLVSGNDFAFAVGPLFGAVTFLLEDTTQRLGLSGDLGLAPIALALMLGIVARFRLAPLSAEQRRFLVTPFVLATSGFFGKFVGGIAGIFDVRAISDVLAAPAQAGEVGLVLGFAVLGVAVFYAMFVYAPRQIAEREGGPITWIVRFALFLVGLAVGTTLRAG